MNNYFGGMSSGCGCGNGFQTQPMFYPSYSGCCSMNNTYGNNSSYYAIILVLFILLVIVIGSRFNN